MFGECSQLLRGWHEAFSQADILKGKKICLAPAQTCFTVTELADGWNEAVSPHFPSSDHPTGQRYMDWASSFKSFKPNLFIKTFQRLLWPIRQVFQMESTDLTKGGFSFNKNSLPTNTFVQTGTRQRCRSLKRNKKNKNLTDSYAANVSLGTYVELTVWLTVKHGHKLMGFSLFCLYLKTLYKCYVSQTWPSPMRTCKLLCLF